MALACALRGLPRSLDGNILRALSRGHFTKISVGSSSLHRLHSPVCLSAVKSFSVTPRRDMSGDHSNHTKLWTAERALSLGLLGAIPAAFIAPSQTMDYILAFALVMHSHWGLEAVVVDYMRPAVVGTVVSKLSMAALYGVSIMTLGGLLYFTYSDVGLTNAVKMFWKL